MDGAFSEIIFVLNTQSRYHIACIGQAMDFLYKFKIWFMFYFFCYRDVVWDIISCWKRSILNHWGPGLMHVQCQAITLMDVVNWIGLKKSLWNMNRSIFWEIGLLCKVKVWTVYYTVWCCYDVVHFLPNPHKISPIARPLGRGMGCNLWVQDLIDSLPQSLQ